MKSTRDQATLDWHQLLIPTPFPVGPVNVYLIKAEPLTLIDTGPNTPDAREALTVALARVGLTPGDIKQVLITHGHGDHAGLAGWFQQLGAQVLIHPKEAEKLSGRDFLAPREELFMQSGIPGTLLESLRPLARQAAGYGTHLANCHYIKGDEKLLFEGFNLLVLATPGHSAGHLAFYQKEAGVMFAGDTILKHISPNPLPEPDPESPGGRSRSLSEFLGTLNLLEQVPVQLVLPGHGEALNDCSCRIAEIRAHHRRRLQHLWDLLQDFVSPYELAARLFGKLEGWDVLLGVLEVCAHLDLMLDRGVITQKRDADGVVRYTANTRGKGNGILV